MAEGSSTTDRSGADSVQNTIPFLSQSHPTTIKLNGSNFLVLKQQILTIILGYELDSYLMDDQVIPPKMIQGADGSSRPNPAFLAWRRQDQLLASWIQSSLTENIMVLIVGMDTTHQIWKALETNFANQSRAKVMQHKSQLQAIKKDTPPMSDYLSKVKSICDVLAASGCRVSEEDQILYILGGLPRDYDPVMVTITAKTDICSVQDASALLLTFEARFPRSMLMALLPQQT